MRTDSRIYVAGHTGLAGSAIRRRLEHLGYRNLVLERRSELDLRHQAAVEQFFAAERPEYVFLAAARVGGILANSSYPADFIYDNLVVQTNVIEAARRFETRKLLFLGSSCVYPRLAPQPIKEEYLLTGELEPTNQWYAIAKIAGIKLCQAFHRQYGFPAISLMPTNLYGPGETYHPRNSHVLPALLQRIHRARLAGEPEVVVWGTGEPRREFLYVDDFADAAVFLMQHYDSPEIINVGTGVDISIADLARLIARVTGYRGAIVFDPAKPDGMPRKLLDVSKLAALGWKATTGLEEGIRRTYESFQASEWAQG
ncbi:MAG TPA: GDP-L-fucose synthase [Bryobacteraceae bacterium]|nr:GDP-L-fucose synthase [Bryobacteraceae bacterium]